MQTQRVNRSDAEKVFIVIKNVDANSITTGMGVRMVGGAAAEIVSTDGVNAVKNAAGSLTPSFVGIAVEDIVSNGYGRVQAWGFVNSIAYSFEADKTVGVTGVTGSFLKMGAAGLFTSAQTQDVSLSGYKYVNAWTTVNISGGVPYGSGFVRGL